MAFLDMKYQQAVQALSLFFRRNGMSETDKFDETPAGNLFRALCQELGDFDSNGIAKFSKHLGKKSITESIWYRTRSDLIHLPEAKPPLITFDELMSSLAISCFLIPHVGILGVVGVELFKDVIDNAGKQTQWFKKVSQVENPPDNPYQQVVDQIIKHEDLAMVSVPIKEVYAQIRSLQSSLNRFLPNGTNQFANGKIKTDPAWRKTYVLGPDGLGQVFTLQESAEFKELLEIRDSPNNDTMVNNTLALSLQINPTFSNIICSSFMHFSVTIVNAILTYAYIYVLPDEALINPDWDGSAFDFKNALRTKGQTRIEGLADTSPTAWDALAGLKSQLDPDSGDFMIRLSDADVVWEKIYERLKMVTFDCDQKANRGGLYYLEKSKVYNIWVRSFRDNDTDLTDKQYAMAETDPERFVLEICKDNQIVCLDSARHDEFVQRFRNFHPSVSIHMHEDAIITTGNFPATVNRDWEHKYTGLRYPVDKSLNGENKKYNDIFWVPGFTRHDYPGIDQLKPAFKDAKKPGFLSTGAGMDIVAWLGMVLVNYCQQFRFHLDIENDTNTLEVAQTIRKMYKADYKAISKLLTEGDT